MDRRSSKPQFNQSMLEPFASAINLLQEARPAWTFLTNHSHVLLCIAREPEIKMRHVAAKVGITERAVQRIIADLEEGGYLARTRRGRGNCYKVIEHLPLRHPVESHGQVAVLIQALVPQVVSPLEGGSDQKALLD